MGKHEQPEQKGDQPEQKGGLAGWELALLEATADATTDPFLAALRQMSRDMDAAGMWGAGFAAGYRMGRGE
jgi:hypothetical protein